MSEGLVGQRHPILSALLKGWHEGGMNAAEQPGALAPYIALLGRADGVWRIDASGAAVDALYGYTLFGAPVSALSPDSDDAENEAQVAFETGRSLAIEQDIDFPDARRRVIRLYLPLAGTAAASDVVLCGIVSAD